MTYVAAIPLNRSEHMGWAAEGYLGSFQLPVLVRFDGPVETAAMRSALRELTTAFPRLRCVMAPTLTTYELRVLPDDEYVEQLFEDAFRVQRTVDPGSRAELEAYQNELLNESLSMERGLPWRARFLPHERHPALFFCVHHMVGDGRSVIDLLGALVARLNGRPIAPCPLEPSSQMPGVLPRRPWHWPASIAAFWRNRRKDRSGARGESVVRLADRRSARFTTSGVSYHELPGGLERLRRAARRRNTTINTLIAASVANALLATAKDDPCAVATIRVSVDLRRFFPEGQRPRIGNYAAAFTVKASHQPTLDAQIRSMEAQAKDHLSRFERREYALPLLLLDWLPIIGRRLASVLFLASKEKGVVVQPSVHISNFGDVDSIQLRGAKVRATEIWPLTLSPVPFLCLAGLGSRLFMSVVYQRDETDTATVKSFLERFDGELRELASEPAPAPHFVS